MFTVVPALSLALLLGMTVHFTYVSHELKQKMAAKESEKLSPTQSARTSD